MLSTENLPAPLTSSVFLSLNGNLLEKKQLGSILLETKLRLAVEERNVPEIRRFAKVFSSYAQYEHATATLVYEYGIKRDAEKCALVLKHVACYSSPMLSFWTALTQQEPELLAWMGEHDNIARYFFLPMPCPNRDWCIEHYVDKNNPGLAFRQWWSSFPQPWRNAINDHLRVEWRRRLIGQPKIYYLISSPSKEQAVFAATRPEGVWDFPLLSQYFPGVELVHTITNQMCDSITSRKQMIQYFEQFDTPLVESYILPSDT